MNRAAKEYGNAQRMRKPTTNTFGVRSTKTTLPAPAARAERTEEPAKPPSYKHADKQQGEKDVEAEDKGKEDEAIRERAGKNPASKEEPEREFTKPAQKVKDNEPDTRGSTSTTVRASQPFENYWSLETSFDLEEVTYEKPNFWTPNALALFEALRVSQRFTVASRIINKHHPEYLEYGVAAYYAVVFHLQILRAREAANRLTGEESTFLRRFRRKFPEETMPIAGHLFPILSSIVSVLLPDPKFNWIVPQTAPDLIGTSTSPNISNMINDHQGGPFLQPSIPMMLAILRHAIREARAGTLTNGTHYDENDYYVTNTLNATADTRIFSNTFRLNQTATHNKNGIFNYIGVNHPFDADPEQLAQAAKHWSRSSFNDLSFDPTHATENISIKDLESFFAMPKTAPMDWFSTLINQATTHARFFTDVRNVSDLPVTGGNEVLVDTTMRKNTAAGAAIDHTTRGLGLILDADAKPWRSDLLRSPIAGFRSTRSAVQRAQVLQALAFGTNASLPITIDANHVGAGVSHRSGKFWSSVDWTLEKYADDFNTATPPVNMNATQGKRMFNGWETMIQEKFVTVKPDGY